MKPKFFTTLLLLCSCVGFLSAQPNIVDSQTDTIAVSVNISEPIGEVSPYILGLNHGVWSGVSLQMQEEAQALDIPFLRWPGGNWGDLYDITEAQLDLYMLESEMWNSVPSVHVRLDSGTPEQAAELVRYANIEKEYGIQHWYIGNEPNLFPDYTSERFSTEWREVALAMREVDPDIILIGPEVSQFPDTTDDNDPNMHLRNEWLRDFLEMNGDLVDIVSVHRYPFPLMMAGPPTTPEQLRNNVPRWTTVVSNLRSIIDETLNRDMPIAITEVNSHWSNSGGSIGSPDSYYNAVWWSGVLTTLIHEDVDLVTYFMLSSVGSNGPFGILDRYKPRPTYYTYLLYGQVGETLLQSESSDDYVTVLATQHNEGSLALIITNLYEEDRTISLAFTDLKDQTLQEIRLLSPEIQAESVTVGDYLEDNLLNIPAQSVMLLTYK